MESSAVSAAFRGQVAVVTGAGGGIGRAIVEALAGQGASLCLVGRTRTTLEAAASGFGTDAQCYPTDLTDEGAVSALVDGVLRDRGRVDVLVHCAGVHAMGAIVDAPASELDSLYRTNVRAPDLLTPSAATGPAADPGADRLRQLQRRAGRAWRRRTVRGDQARAESSCRQPS